MTAHLPLLAAEATLSAGIVLALFRWRRQLGMAPLYLVLGALQNLQFVFAASLRLPLVPGLEAGPATVVLFPLTTFVVLLTYVDEDAAATRSFAYGLVICNLTLYGLSALAGQHVELPGVSNPLGLPRALFPQLPAETVIAQARRRWPELSIFLVSGYDHGAEIAAQEGLLFFAKPLNFDELRQAVASVLRKNRPPST